MNRERAWEFALMYFRQLRMNDKTIQLQYIRKDFEEIYFRNGNRKTLLNAQFKRERMAAITIGTAFLATLIYVIVANKKGGFAIILGILFCVAFYDLFKKASPML